MDFKLDENLHPDTADLLRQQGHNAATVYEQGLRDRPDPEIARVCIQEGRALITLDLDFSDLRKFPPTDHSGIVVLRLGSQSRRSVLAAVQRILPLIESEPLSGFLWIVDEIHVRIRGQNVEDAERN